MKSVLRRFGLLALFAVTLAGVGLHGSCVQAQTNNWEYSDAWGGWLDWDTGLVWGEHGINVAQTSFMWNTVDPYLENYRTLTGISQWRLPTVAESQMAVSHGINAVVPGGRTGLACWTSESKSKGWAKSAHYAVFLSSGNVTLFNNSSALDVIPVYRLFTP